MRNCLLFILCLCFAAVHAQTRSIEFREGNWENVLQLAKKEKKMIFVDCYTSWCGPCKMLAKNVFTQDAVADFYNTHFICVQMDMEKGEGPVLAKRYEVSAYPTLLYIDTTGFLRHCVTGYMPPAVLLSNGKTALSGKATLDEFKARYDAGERDTTFVRQYLEVLFKACRPALQKEVATEYINTLDERQFYTRSTWEVIIRHLSDPLSPILKKVMQKKFRFCSFVAQDTVDLFLNYTLKSAVSAFVWRDFQKNGFDRQRYDDLLGYLFTVDLPRVPQYVASLYAARKVAEGDIRGMFAEMHRSISYGIFYNSDAKLDFIRSFLRRIEVCGDMALVEEADKWVVTWIDSYKAGYYKSEYMLIRARMLRVMGENGKADELEREARKVRMMNE